MKKYLVIYIICFFAFNPLKAQEVHQKINLALLNFDLTNKKLGYDEQEMFLSTLLSLGDNQIVMEEIVRRILISPNATSSDSILNLIVKGFTKKDSKIINSYPRCLEDWRDEPFYLVRMSLLGQAFLDSVSLAETYLEIQKDQPTKFPNIPSDVYLYNDNLLGHAEKILSYVKWVVNYPLEYQYFIELIKKQTQQFYGEASNQNIIKFTNHVKNEAIQNNKVERENIPTTFNTVMYYYNSQRKIQLKYVELCQPETIDSFISNAYQLIYQKSIPEKIATSFGQYIKQQKIYDAELIYMALILNRYE